MSFKWLHSQKISPINHDHDFSARPQRSMHWLQSSSGWRGSNFLRELDCMTVGVPFLPTAAAWQPFVDMNIVVSRPRFKDTESMKASANDQPKLAHLTLARKSPITDRLHKTLDAAGCKS